MSVAARRHAMNRLAVAMPVLIVIAGLLAGPGGMDARSARPAALTPFVAAGAGPTAVLGTTGAPATAAAPSALPPRLQGIAAEPVTATIEVTTPMTFGTEARAAVQSAADIWSRTIVSSQTIHVHASWAPLPPGILAWASATQLFQGSDGYLYPAALAESRCGCDLWPTEVAIVLTDRVAWATGGTVAANRWDLVSAALHAIAQGLAFSTTFSVADGIGTWGILTSGPARHALAFDRYVVGRSDGAGQLIDTDYVPNPSIALARELTDHSVYWAGPNGVATYGGLIPLYAPSPWMDGSSIGHVEDGVAASPSGDQLMTPAMAIGLGIRTLSPLLLAVLADIGWASTAWPAPTPTPVPTPTPTPAPYLESLAGGASGTIAAPPSLGSFEITLTAGPDGASITVAAASVPAAGRAGARPFRRADAGPVVDVAITGGVPPYLLCAPDQDGSHRLWHREGGPRQTWVDISWRAYAGAMPVAGGLSPADHAGQVCGMTMTLSPFVAAVPKPDVTIAIRTGAARLRAGALAAIRVRVEGDEGMPSGTVTIRRSSPTGPRLGRCRLSAAGTCTVRAPLRAEGVLRLWAVYAGDVTYRSGAASVIRSVAGAGPEAGAGPIATEPAHESGSSPAPGPSATPPPPSPAP